MFFSFVIILHNKPTFLFYYYSIYRYNFAKTLGILSVCKQILQKFYKCLHSFFGSIFVLISSSSKFLTAITSGINPPIIKVKYGVYAVNQKPVDKERLQTVFDEYVKLNYIHFVKYKKKKISIEQAIYVLKNAGYKVLKPVTQYEEA